MGRDVKEYALYKGEDILSIGTVREIAEEQGVLIDTIKYYKTQAYQNKIAKRKRTKNTRILVLLQEDEDE